ncbi:MAG TPA: DHA2 family efflux MFS transporter permease subunit [Gemmatimonadales bacterium]|nr:DHA2 family efflux MFS transporter permease subunit [Gemmatimonadales bacterium]
MSARTTNKWVIAITVMTGSVMAVLDSSIVNVALPDMAGTLGATIEEITWVITGYILANVIIMPIIGLLSARFGRKRMYQASVLLFTGASMACGTASSLSLIVVFRVIQGLGGGVLITVSQAILRETFPADEQGLAMGIYGMGVVLAPAFGPTLGGWLTDQYSWPWIFFINVPIGALNLFLVNRFLQDPPYLVRERGRIDWLGLSLMTVGLGSLQYMLEKGETKDWFESRMIVTLAIVAAAGLILFIWRELTTDRPAVDLRILRNVQFSAATFIGGILGMGLYASLFILPLFLQNLLGYPAMKSGLALMPRSLAMAVVMPISGRFYNRLGPRVLITAGLIVSAYSFWELSHLTTQTGFWDIFVPQVWQGVGFSLLFVALSTAALSTIAKPEMTAATGLYNVVRQVAGSVGIAAAATEITRGSARAFAGITPQVTMFDQSVRDWLHGAVALFTRNGAGPVEAQRSALALLEGKILRQATVIAYNHVFQMIAILFLVAFPLVIMLRKVQGAETGEIMVE